MAETSNAPLNSEVLSEPVTVSFASTDATEAKKSKKTMSETKYVNYFNGKNRFEKNGNVKFDFHRKWGPQKEILAVQE